MGKLFTSRYLVIIAVVAVSLLATNASAKETEKKNINSKIAVVNMDIILQKSIAAKNLKSQIEKKRKEYKNVIKKREKDLASFQKGVMKEKDNMKKEELNAKKKIFQQKIITAQKDTQEEVREIDKAINNALQNLRVKATEIVADIAKEKGFDIVLSHKQVVIATKNLDITAEVLKRLDKQVKSIKIKWK